MFFVQHFHLLQQERQRLGTTDRLDFLFYLKITKNSAGDLIFSYTEQQNHFPPNIFQHFYLFLSAHQPTNQTDQTNNQSGSHTLKQFFFSFKMVFFRALISKKKGISRDTNTCLLPNSEN